MAVVVASASAPACRSNSASPATQRPVRAETSVGSADNHPGVEVSLTRLLDDVWLHTSVRELEPYGRVVSHGLLIVGDGGALLVDTAWGEGPTHRLLAMIESSTGHKPVAAVLTDFHADRAGGAQALAAAGVDVHTTSGILSRIGLEGVAEPLAEPVAPLQIAGVDLEVFAPGPGHSPENLTVWLPKHQLLFGGCLVRPFGSRELGNTADADIQRWGSSVTAVRQRYPSAKVVIPSHGAPGDVQLLDHTLALVEGGLWAQSKQSGAPAPPTRMAITVDDLPRHGPLPAGMTRTEVHAQLIDAFDRHHVPGVWGFVNGQRAETEDELDALQAWVKAGHPVGNHTWSHPDLRQVSVVDYLKDIDRNEALLARIGGAGDSWKVFRYPYLQQGIDEDSTTKIRAHLATAGYKIAEVSIDFWDWDYQQPFFRCLESGSEVGLDALRRTFLQRAVSMLRWHKAAAVQAFERPIAHVLLLHAGAFTAEMVEPLLAQYEARGVVWVSLEEALADPVYRDVPSPAKTRGDVIVEQAITTLGADHPPWSPHPGALLAALCSNDGRPRR